LLIRASLSTPGAILKSNELTDYDGSKLRASAPLGLDCHSFGVRLAHSYRFIPYVFDLSNE